MTENDPLFDGVAEKKLMFFDRRCCDGRARPSQIALAQIAFKNGAVCRFKPQLYGRAPWAPSTPAAIATPEATSATACKLMASAKAYSLLRKA